MSRISTTLLTVCALLAFGSLSAQDDSYTLGFSGPDTLSGNVGDTPSATYTLLLTHEGPGPGAQGWSISLATENALITAINDGIDDGSSDSAAEFDTGFKQTETLSAENDSVGDCAGKAGAVSAIVLSLTMPAVLPPNTTKSIGSIDVEATIPDGGGTASVSYTNGCAGSGQPVDNNVTQSGDTVIPTLGSQSINLVVVVSCCNAPQNLSFSDERLSSAESGPNVGLDAKLCLTPETLTPAPGSADVYINISSNAAGLPAVQGWSLSAAVEGDITLDGATTDGTTAADEPDGLRDTGFDQTEVVNPDLDIGDGPQGPGVVSAVVLSLTMPIVLPEVGTESVLKLSISGEDGQTGAVSLRDGLTGAGQPVANVLTVGGDSVAACNIAQASAPISFELPPGKLFVRGDPNGDSRLDIADAIWIIYELFLSGPASSCQAAADVNADVNVDISDAAYIIDYQFMGGPAPVTPSVGDCELESLDVGLPCDEHACSG